MDSSSGQIEVLSDGDFIVSKRRNPQTLQGPVKAQVDDSRKRVVYNDVLINLGQNFDYVSSFLLNF